MRTWRIQRAARLSARRIASGWDGVVFASVALGGPVVSDATVVVLEVVRSHEAGRPHARRVDPGEAFLAGNAMRYLAR